MNLVTSLESEEVGSVCMCVSKRLVRLCCPGVPRTLLELHRQHAFVFYLGLCMFSCKITGTWFKSNGPKEIKENHVMLLCINMYAYSYIDKLFVLSLHGLVMIFDSFTRHTSFSVIQQKFNTKLNNHNKLINWV